jgi:hypothetical protein
MASCPPFSTRRNAVDRDFHPEKASLVCEDYLIGGKSGCILQAGPDVLRPELRKCRKGDLARFTGSKLFQNQIDGNSGPFETALPHHHVRPSFNPLRKLHTLNSIRGIRCRIGHGLFRRAQADSAVLISQNPFRGSDPSGRPNPPFLRMARMSVRAVQRRPKVWVSASRHGRSHAHLQSLGSDVSRQLVLPIDFREVLDTKPQHSGQRTTLLGRHADKHYFLKSADAHLCLSEPLPPNSGQPDLDDSAMRPG